jgi:hypothetical protein
MPEEGDVAADPLDILTPAEAKGSFNALGSDWDSAWDTELEQIITAASRFVDSVYGPVVKRTITGERHDSAADLVALKYRPVLSVTTVTEYQGGAPTVLTAETEAAAGGYRVDLATGRVYRRSSWAGYPFGYQSVVVTYVAGRANDTVSVDPKFKIAAKLAVVHLWQHFGAGGGAAVSGGEGPAFGAVPFSSEVLRKKLMDLYPEEVIGSVGSPLGPLVG